MICALTVWWDFKAWLSTLTGDQTGKASLNEHALHKASKESCVSVWVDVRYRFTGHLPLLIHLPNHTAPILETPQ